MFFRKILLMWALSFSQRWHFSMDPSPQSYLIFFLQKGVTYCERWYPGKKEHIYIYLLAIYPLFAPYQYKKHPILTGKITHLNPFQRHQLRDFLIIILWPLLCSSSGSIEIAYELNRSQKYSDEEIFLPFHLISLILCNMVHFSFHSPIVWDSFTPSWLPWNLLWDCVHFWCVSD